MILVKASAGLVIELATGPSGRWDILFMRLAPWPHPFRFEVGESPEGLNVRPLEALPLAALMAALEELAGNEAQLLAEVRKYRSAR